MTFSAMLSTYFAGFLTSLTPCVYPMIPLSLGYLGSRGSGLRRTTILAFVAGQVFMFSLMGLIAVQLGEVFGFLSESIGVQIGTGLMLAVFAYYSWKEELPVFLNRMGRKVSSTHDGKASMSFFGAFVAGLVSTIVASPCSTPVLGGVLVLISSSDSFIAGGLLMTLYGLGLSTLFLVIGLGLFKTQQLPRSGLWMKRVHKVSVILLILSSIYFLGRGFSAWNL